VAKLSDEKVKEKVENIIGKRMGMLISITSVQATMSGWAILEQQ